MDSGYNDTCHVKLIKGDHVKACKKDLTQSLHIGCFEMLSRPSACNVVNAETVYVQCVQKRRNEGG